MKICNPYEFHDKTINKTWIRYPVLIELKEKPEITLDWEHTEHNWTTLHEINSYDLAEGFNESLRKVLS
jgi:hypothetical protein